MGDSVSWMDGSRRDGGGGRKPRPWAVGRVKIILGIFLRPIWALLFLRKSQRKEEGSETEPASKAGGGGGDTQFLRGGGGLGGGGVGGMAWEVVRRHFSRKRAVDVRQISPKVPKEEAVAISGRLLQILTDHGPLTVGSTWNQAKDAAINGLNSKTHMKILLKWMTGRRVVKLSCVHDGKVKKFLYSPFTDSPETATEALPEQPKEPSTKGRKAYAQEADCSFALTATSPGPIMT